MEHNGWHRFAINVGLFLSALVLALFVLLVLTALAQDYPFTSMEIREWAGALSGWAAAVAAAWAVLQARGQARRAEAARGALEKGLQKRVREARAELLYWVREVDGLATGRTKQFLAPELSRTTYPELPREELSLSELPGQYDTEFRTLGGFVARRNSDASDETKTMNVIEHTRHIAKASTKLLQKMEEDSLFRP